MLPHIMRMKVRVYGLNRVHAIIHVMMKLKWLVLIPVFLFGRISVMHAVDYLMKKLITVEAVKNAS